MFNIVERMFMYTYCVYAYVCVYEYMCVYVLIIVIKEEYVMNLRKCGTWHSGKLKGKCQVQIV